MEKSTEQVSNSYLKLNSCGIQKLWDRDYLRIREHGRVDYHIIYILHGKCTAESEGNETILECGDMILFMPGEKQKYAFHAAYLFSSDRRSFLASIPAAYPVRLPLAPMTR